MTTRAAAPAARASPLWFVALALPLAGLAFLIARPDLDHEWKHQPSHFWLVLGVALVSLALAYFTHEAATRHRDARLILISLAFGAAAGFLGLHALGATAGDRPRFHIGINTGPAYVGSIGAAGRRTFSAIGDTTNLAARLEGAAASGEIVIGEATWHRLDGARGQLIEGLELKGKRLPVRAWRLDALRDE